jgi:predicted DsbA family dithiol-disulfide isomerase
VEVEKLQRKWDVDVDWAPFLLDPSIPPEGRERAPRTTAETPKSALEERGESLGIEFRRGRTFTPNSYLSLQAGAFAKEHGTEQQQHEFHKVMFEAHFTTLENLGEIETLKTLATGVGLDGGALAEALADKRYREQVDHDIDWARSAGVTGIPTFILNGQYAVVGAQPYEVFEQAMEQLGAKRRGGADGAASEEAAGVD